jgi:hypothetical protein
MSEGNLLLSECGHPNLKQSTDSKGVEMNEAMKAALEQCLEHLYAPNANCSCHISPPCNDCVDYAGIRDAIRDAKAALSQQQAQSTMLRKPTIITKEDRNMIKNATCFANDGAERDWSELESSQQPAQPDTSLLGSLAKNWQEDSSHENGNYGCKCSACNSMFLGHKRRVICKECLIKPAQPTVKDSLTVQAQPSCECTRSHPHEDMSDACAQESIKAERDNFRRHIESLRAENEQLKENAKRLDDLFGRVIAERNSAENSMCEFRAENERLKEYYHTAIELIRDVYRHGVHPSILDGSDVRLIERLGIFLGANEVEDEK